MNNSETTPNCEANPQKNLKQQVNWSLVIPGIIIVLAILAFALLFGEKALPALNAALDWEMGNFKWLWILCCAGTIFVLFYLMLGKYGNIVIGGRNAKPSVSTFTWFALTVTVGICVGICFFGVAGPLSYFINPPAFLGIEGGTPEAVVPAITYTYLHWAFGPYAVLVFAGLVLAFAYYNMKRAFRPGSMLYSLVGRKGEKTIGWIVDLSLFAMLVINSTNCGLSAIQLSAGFNYVFGINISTTFFIILYGVVACFVVLSRVHGLMGGVSKVNVYIYIIMLAAVLFFGPTNRLLLTLFESVGSYIHNLIPMSTFGDVALETGWQNTETMFYISWSLAPCIYASLFYALMARGHTIKEYVMVQFLAPCVLIFLWYAFFGGTAIYQYMGGDHSIAEALATNGSGYATFAFLDKLPLASITKIIYIIMTFVTYLTAADGGLFAFPKMLVKGDRAKSDSEHAPAPLVIGKAVADTVLCIVLINIGGADALSIVTILVTLPVAVVMVAATVSFFKALIKRKKYDATYIEECIEDGNWTEEDALAVDQSIMESVGQE